jgi:hypothetical protein
MNSKNDRAKTGENINIDLGSSIEKFLAHLRKCNNLFMLKYIFYVREKFKWG